MNQIKELKDFIVGQETDITKFDEALVKKLIDKITVLADRFTEEFKSGITIDIEAQKGSSPPTQLPVARSLGLLFLRFGRSPLHCFFHSFFKYLCRDESYAFLIVTEHN